jgi:predicted ATP-dependent endonuclease of OLD family
MSTKAEERPRVYLNSVHLKGFKSIEDLTIDFKRGLNILIGKNGSGKSNFLEFIDFIIRFNNKSKIPYKYAKVEILSNDNHSFSIETERIVPSKFSKEDLQDLPEAIEKISIDGNIEFDSLKSDDFKKRIVFKNKKVPYKGNLAFFFNRLGYGPIFPTYIKYNIPSNLEVIDVPGTLKLDIEDEYGEWNSNTLSFVNNILWDIESMYFDPDGINALTAHDFNNELQKQVSILANVRRFTNIEDLRFNSNINSYSIDKFVTIENIKLEFKVNGNWLPWSQLSDGTRRLFYTITEVTVSTGQILFEEPELGVHPHQFNLLMDFLKEQSEDKQIIISTHSPKALDHLSPEELDHILIAYYDLEKGTQIRHLSDKEIKKAQNYMKEVGFFSDYWMLSDLE